MAKNITITRMNTQNISLSVAPITITAEDTVFFTAKPKYDDDTGDNNAVIKKDITGDVGNDPLTFELTPTETNIKAGKYFYDITLQKADGKRTTLLSGKITVKPVATLRGAN